MVERNIEYVMTYYRPELAVRAGIPHRSKEVVGGLKSALIGGTSSNVRRKLGFVLIAQESNKVLLFLNMNRGMKKYLLWEG